MENLTFYGFILLLLLGCQQIEPGNAAPDRLSGEVAELRRTHAPDRRTDRVEVTVTAEGEQRFLEGYTTVPAAFAALDSLAASDDRLTNRTRLLGEPADLGLIRVSVANIRTERGHSSELTSQALMGTPVELLDKEDGWWLIRTPDRYIAWLEEGALVEVSPAEMERWFADSLFTCAPAQTTAYAAAGSDKIVTELVAGDLVRRSGQTEGDWSGIELPDGRRAYVPADELRAYEDFSHPEAVDVDAVLLTAFAQVGKPYLWGGTSAKAMDCSGFTKTAYYLNGYVIPRDASQQVHAGRDVPLDDDFAALRRGDLLFFGNYREDGSERVTHVGFYLGEGRFLHAGADNGYITENSLREEDADFAPHRLESLLRARRLREGTGGVAPVDDAFRALYTRSSSR